MIESIKNNMGDSEEE